MKTIYTYRKRREDDTLLKSFKSYLRHCLTNCDLLRSTARAAKQIPARSRSFSTAK